MSRKKANCTNCGDCREIVGFGLCLKCYSQKRRDDLRDGLSPFRFGPDESQRNDRHALAVQRQNLAKMLTILEGAPICDLYLPVERKRKISEWFMEAVDLINRSVSCLDNTENEVVAATEEVEPKPETERKQKDGQPYIFPSNPAAKSGVANDEG